MRYRRPRQLDYSRSTPSEKSVSAYGYCGLALVPVQFVWLFGWALFQRSIFADGQPKRPLTDFFVELGIAVPTVAILCLGLVRCSIELRRSGSLRNCVHWLWVLGAASVAVLLVVFGWVVDDIVHVNVTH